jgi:hypothetical protein
VKNYRGRLRSAYDGKVAATLNGGADGPFLTAQLDRWPAWQGINPLEFTTHYFREPVSKFLVRRGVRVVGQEIWDSRPVTIVEDEPGTFDCKGLRYRSREPGSPASRDPVVRTPRELAGLLPRAAPRARSPSASHQGSGWPRWK